MNSESYAYDEIPFHGGPIYESHPSNLAVTARLFGLDPVPVGNCRVLELCCGNGINILSMAADLPNSTFVGVDLSQAAIDEGESFRHAMNLENASLGCLDIFSLPSDIGLFDYVVMTGAFTWFAENDQRRILELCKRLLSKDGIVYIRYNVFPGAHVSLALREMMLVGSKKVGAPKDKVVKARRHAGFLTQALMGICPKDDAYYAIANTWLNELKSSSDEDLYHEYLGDIVTPLYFSDFASKAEDEGLQFLSEANAKDLHVGVYPKQIAGHLESVSEDRIELEQNIDFIRFRNVRESLLCHAEHSVERNISADVIEEFSILSMARPANGLINLASGVSEKFATVGGAGLSTSNPVCKALLLVLGECWPKPLGFDALLSAIRVKCEQGGLSLKIEAKDLQATLLQYYFREIVLFFSGASKVAGKVSEKPVASLLARHIVMNCDQLVRMKRIKNASGITVYSLISRPVLLEPSWAKVLSCLDGEHSRPQLIDVMRGLNDYAQLDAKGLSEKLDQLLKYFMDNSLLIEEKPAVSA